MAKNGGKESDAGDLNEKELVTADCEGNLCQPSHYFSILCSYLVFFSLSCSNCIRIQGKEFFLHHFFFRVTD